MPDRIIKESICTSDTLNKLTDFEERFWHRLTVNCDDYGRFDARPAILRGRLFPLRDGTTDRNMEEALNKLASVGLVALYVVDGKPYLQLVTWAKHQRIRAKRSKFPDPDGACRQMTADDGKCPRNPIQSESNPMRESEAESNTRDPRLAAVASAYLDRVNPSASQQSLEELSAFCEALGPDVCLRAIDIALDEKKATWSYIRGILRRLQSQGVKCLADIERVEAEREHGKAFSKKDPKSGYFGGKADPSALKDDMDWMDRFLEKQEGQ